VIIVWALDRITRLGAEDALKLIRQFRERGVTLVSVRESWLNGSPEVQDVLVAFAGWMAQQESRRHSERVRAGMERARCEGTKSGRPIGGRQRRTKDRKPRPRAGYVAEQARRKASA
jgi:putative DNA-invertase from lambdoid prophage Rac